MPNKHFCQGPNCHTYPTTDRFLKSRGVIRGRYAYATMDQPIKWLAIRQSKFFCSQACKNEWLNENMESIEQADRLSLLDTDERVVITNDVVEQIILYTG